MASSPLGNPELTNILIGPSEITVFHPDVYIAIDGPFTKCNKAEWYDLLHPNKALVTARTEVAHRTRRNQWSRGFSPKTLPHYKEQILPLIDQLDNCIQTDIATCRVSEVSDLFQWLAFDRMGKFVLGKSFNMLTNQNWHHIVVRLEKALSILGFLSPVPWLVQIAFRLLPPVWLLKDWAAMRGWCENELKEIELPTTDSCQAPALAHFLKYDSSNDNCYEDWLTGDAILAIVAGSSPTGGVILGLFYELAKNPIHTETIYGEIVQQGVNILDSQDLARRCPHLQAAIFEAMRLYPSLPTGGNRKTSSTEGITNAGVYILPETTVVAPRFVIARPGEDCFIDANSFVPERWTTRPEMVRNRAAMSPFGIGRCETVWIGCCQGSDRSLLGHRTCPGKTLAMNDIMLVAAHLVRRYHFRFPLGETGETLIRCWRDHFTTHLGRLRLVFEMRKD
ncbi:cytochrome P450 [Penicillium capsulatum]|uniref:Cytochrome P450 n=1 Tax=Penicillium capsulatum TaxID=69766 RepID=A0A9W9HS11_9EURO|nr:cytochrome P450 [Penicillium capsulatum]KAJ6105564.1 cytochrome P450 [Penicillium capsulatum]